MKAKTVKTKNKKVIVAPEKSLLKDVRVTEKSTNLLQKNIYVFNVATNATKPEIKKIIKTKYKVTPIHINMITIHPKRVVVRGRLGSKKGGKKAYIYLKKGDKIDQ